MIYKIIFFLAIATFLASSINAQKFSLGLAGGTHIYKVAFHHDEEESFFKSKNKLGYKLGGFIEFPLENNFSWSTEAYYSKKGRKVSYYNGAITNNADYNFYEISVLLRKGYDMAVSSKLKGELFFNIGPNVNYWSSGSGTIDANVDLDYEVKFQEPDGNVFVNSINDANRWLFGLEAGVGAEIRVYDTQFFEVELRYTYGQTYLGGKDSSTIPILAFEDSLRSNYRVLSMILRYGVDIDLKNARKGKSTIKRKKR
ncbi:PorT family protein [Fulvivirga sp. 29W222]|uniref:PorT family protein n=1 Tax=Fulvivirga marina TaxID=2494733 RepID=A0A937FV43_9BACT|nr:outer membrane beta-barrel protein [Fulvivirga marina]MBL6444786.1 PorT family protein [Fulvivirga marina]